MVANDGLGFVGIAKIFGVHVEPGDAGGAPIRRYREISRRHDVVPVAKVKAGARFCFKVIMVNPNRMLSDTVFHEFGHLYIELLGGLRDPYIREAIKKLKGTEFYNIDTLFFHFCAMESGKCHNGPFPSPIFKSLPAAMTCSI